MAQAVQAPDVTGIFQPLMVEHDYVVDQIDGTLPPDLTGTLYRIGPGKWQVGRTMLHHLFDGDGMVSQFILDGRSVRYRNRYVRTEHFRHGLVSNEIRWPGIGTRAQRKLSRLPANTANTNLLHHNGELLALWEAGHPYRLDPDTLETLGPYDFDGKLGTFQFFSAHPKRDSATGDWFNFGFSYVPRPRLLCYRIDRKGRLHHLASVSLRQLVVNHDMALTTRHLVFALNPHTINRRKFALGVPIMDASEFHPDQSTRFLLVPRDGGPPRIAEHDAFFSFHITNAYEDGTDTIVDLVRLDDDYAKMKRVLRDIRTTTDAPQTRLVRYRITPSGRVIEQELSPYSGEFPQYDWRVTTRRHRYSYLAIATTPSAAYDSLLKIDHDTEAVQSHHLGDDSFVGEPIFVPRRPDSAEDDGWLLAVNYAARDNRSQLVILDAARPDRDPVAVAQLPHHIPFGFHGSFTRRVADPDAPIPLPR